MAATPQYNITGHTRIYGVISDPISHVRAPMVYNPIFKERGIDAVMIPLHITPDTLEPVIKSLARIPNVGGVCVTIPHKMELAKLCDELSLAARFTDAVNAVRFDDGRLIGDNFDGKGFVAGLLGEGIDPSGKKVVMIGAGGAARAITAALAEGGVGNLTIANRTIKKAEKIVAMLADLKQNPDLGVVAMADINQALADADIIINTTSLGLNEGDTHPCDLAAAKAGAVVADIIMVPAVTGWMKAAETRGLRVHAGHHMLDYQRDPMGAFLKMWN